MSAGLFASIREACRRVAEGAEQVRIDGAALDGLAVRLASESAPPSEDPVHAPFADDATTLAFVATLDAINFGSGWFPVLRKPSGRSGYFTIAQALRERFEKHGPFTAGELAGLDVEACSALFGQPHDEARELMALFAQALHDLGAWLAGEHDGSFENAIGAAGGSAEALVARLAEMPLYRDVSRYAGFEVPLYKRAQITASDLAAAFGQAGYGRFHDLDALTLFADNLVPHVLRCEGVLVYADDLAARIDAEKPLAHGEPAEVEIRAVGLHAVECLSAACERAGRPLLPRELDTQLWQRGQAPEFKSRPRHRARCAYY